MRRFFVIAFCAVLVNFGWGSTWNDGSSSDWNTPANWNPSGVPNSSTATVALPGSATTLSLNVDGTFQVAEIDFNGSSAVTLSAATTGILQIGTLTTNSTLTFAGAGPYIINVPLTLIGATSTGFIPTTQFSMSMSSGAVTLGAVTVSAATSSAVGGLANINVTSATTTPQSVILSGPITLNTTGTVFGSSSYNLCSATIGANVTASLAANTAVTMTYCNLVGAGTVYVPTSSTLAFSNGGTLNFTAGNVDVNITGPGSVFFNGTFQIPSLPSSGGWSYSGPTYVTPPSTSTLHASSFGVTGATNALSNQSVVVIQGHARLLLNNTAQTIAGLSATASMLTDVFGYGVSTLSIGSASGSTISSYGGSLTVLARGGGIFNVQIGGGALTLTGEQGTGSGYIYPNFFPWNGNTTITAGTLVSGATGAFSGLSPVIMSGAGALVLQTFPDQIAGLSSTSTLAIVNLGASSSGLTIAPITVTSNGSVATLIASSNTSGTFAGQMIGSGGLTLGGSYTLGLQNTGFTNPVLSATAPYSLILTGASNTYSGLTTLSTNSQLIAGTTNAFSSSSAVTLASTATLNLNGFSQTIAGLLGSGVVTANTASLTLTGSTNTNFSGSITGLNGLTFNGASAATISGPITLVGSSSTTSIPTVAITLSASGAPPVISSVTVPSGDMANLNIVSTGGAQTIILSSGTIDLNATGANYFNPAVAQLSIGTNVTASLAAASAVTLSSCNLNGAGKLYIPSGATLGMTMPPEDGLNYIDTTITGGGSAQFQGNYYLGGQTGATLSYTGTTYLLTPSVGAGFFQAVDSIGNGFPSNSTIVMQPNTGMLLDSHSNTTSTIVGFESTVANSSSILVLGSGGTLAVSPGSASSSFSYGGLLGLYYGVTSPFNIAIDQGSLTLTGPSSTSILNLPAAYYPQNGLTIISNALLVGGNTGVFSGVSSVTMSGSATLSIATSSTQSFSQQIAGLSSSSTLATVNLGSGATNGVLTIVPVSLTANNSTFTISAAPVTSGTFAGSIVGTGGLTLGGGYTLGTQSVTSPYSLTLTGASNIYSGLTTLSTNSQLIAGIASAFSPNSAVTLGSGATLNLNNFANTIQTLEGSGFVATGGGSGGILTVSNGNNQTYSGAISGNGGFVLSGGSLSLSGSNTFAGPTTISSGATLTAAAVNALSSGSALTVNGSLLAEATDVLTPLAPITINGLLDLSGYDETIANQILGSGRITSSSPATLTFSGNTSSTCSCQLTGALGLTLANDYALSLSPNTNNNNTGPTTIDGGSLLTVRGNNILSPYSPMAVNSGGTLSLGGSNKVSDLSGGGAIAIAAGKTLTFGDSNSTTFSGPITGGALYQQGTGTFTFTGTGALSGGVTVSSGRWNMDSTNWVGPMTILPSGTLGGTGALSSSVTLQGGTIAPGHSSGVLTFNPGSTVVFSSDSTYLVSIDSAGNSELLLGANTTLDGLLSVTVAAGTTLQDQYTILEMIDGSYTGKFSSISFPRNFPFLVDYLPTSVLLTTVQPTSFSSLSGNRARLIHYLVQFPEPALQLSFLPIGTLEQALDRISPARNFAGAFALQNSAVGLSKQLSWRLADRRHLLTQRKEPTTTAFRTITPLYSKYSLVADAQETILEPTFVATESTPSAEETTTPVATESTPSTEETTTPVATESSPSTEETTTPVATDSSPSAEETTTPVATESSPSTEETNSFFSHGEWWISGMGQFGHLAATAQAQNPAFNFNAGAALLGCDYGGETALAGFSAGYLKDISMMAGDFGSASSDSLVLMLYGTYNPSPFWITLSLLEATSWFNNERNISFPAYIPSASSFSATATSEHTGWTLDPHIDLGYAFDFTWGSISPYVAFDAAIVWEEDYNEEGAAPYNFNFPTRTSELFRTEVGLDFRQNLFWKELSVMFKEMLSYVNQTTAGNQMNTTLFNGGLAVSPGIPFVALTTATGTENLFQPVFEVYMQWRDFSFSTTYAGQFGSNFHSNEVFGTLGYQF
ncbi:MAG: hypothetical protein KGI80_03195 [Verrucomicrobiota bacterium]|nr:hypothetical protein [Verrucomicrobiota bacterium]